VVAISLVILSLPQSVKVGLPSGYGTWDLKFSDEFNSTALDTNKWNKTWWWGDGTSNTYPLTYFAPDAFSLSNGKLHIKAEKRNYQGKPYTGGVITTKGKFSQTYGYFEIRAKVPKGKGMWPAFWLLPEDKNWPPELDVFEILGHETNRDWMTVHYKDDKGNHQSVGNGGWYGPDFATDYHTFGMLWDWKYWQIVWYVDGVECFKSKLGVPSQPMYLLVNLGVGISDWQGQTYNPDSSTPLPNQLSIDWIRVWQHR